MTAWWRGPLFLFAGVSLGASCESDEGGGGGSGGNAATAGQGGSAGAAGTGTSGSGATTMDAGCIPGALDGGCVGVGGSAGTGAAGAGGGGMTCESIGRAECVGFDPVVLLNTCPKTAYKCVDGIGFTTASLCNPLIPTQPEPRCCGTREESCAHHDAVDCQFLNGLETCLDCVDDNGGVWDENTCKDPGAACTTNNECCNRCCSGGQCIG